MIKKMETENSCPICFSKTEMKSEVKGSCLICTCKDCGAEFVTSHLPDYLFKTYKVYIDCKNSQKSQVIRAVKDIFKVSMSEAREKVTEEDLLVFEGSYQEKESLIEAYKDKLKLKIITKKST